MTSSLSTKQCIISLIDDIELISKQYLEMIAAPKAKQNDDLDTDELLELLIQKDKELKEQLKIASEQAELQKKYDALRAEVDKRDQNIKHLQKTFKEAESILGTAIYQAKQKLASIDRANNRKISSEELIKYAHKISASNAVAAPPTWGPGDPRRPYPTDIDMRCGILARLNDNTINTQALSSANTLSEVLGHGRQNLHLGMQPPQQQTPSYQWPSSLDSLTPPQGGGLNPGLPLQGGGTPGLPTSHSPRQGGGGSTPGHHVPLDVSDQPEIISSDSSSSSSSDE